MGPTGVRAGMAAIAAAYLIATLALLPVGADDIAMVGVFSSDEANIDSQVLKLYDLGLTSAPAFKYGGAFFYPPSLAVHAVGFVGQVTQETVVLAVRLFCIVSGLGCLALTFVLGRDLAGGLAGLLSALMLCLTPVFLRWSVEGHPDLPQLFWMLGALVCCARAASDSRRWWPILAGACAGLAFGTKYGGAFLLPVIAASILVAGERRLTASVLPGVVKRRLTSSGFWIVLTASGAAFGLSFVATNPFAVLRPDEFLAALTRERAIMGFGHTLEVSTSAFQWLPMLLSEAGVAHAAAAAAGAVVILLTIRTTGLSTGAALVLLWIAIYLGYLGIEVQVRRSRHLLPVLPCVYVLAATLYIVVIDGLRRWSPGGTVRALLLTGIAATFVQPAIGWAGHYAGRWNREELMAPELSAGRWLAESVPTEATILYDAYSYVPAEFIKSYRVFGLSYLLIQHFEPSVVVIRDAIASDFADTTDAASARLGRQTFLDQHYFYRYLKEGLIPEYDLVRDFGSVRVYARNRPRYRLPEVDGQGWYQLVDHAVHNRLFGLVTAHWVMGDIHAQQGKPDLAAWMYERSRSKRNFIARLFRWASVEALSGRPGAAESAFLEIGSWLSHQPDATRAAFREAFRDQLEGLQALRSNPRVDLLLRAAGALG